MKTKEQKRKEAENKKDLVLTERLEIGIIKQLENRLENLSKRPGESKREKARILKQIEEWKNIQSQQTVKEAKSTSEAKRLQMLKEQKSKVGK